MAEAYTRAFLEGKPRSFEDLEAELLRGQVNVSEPKSRNLRTVKRSPVFMPVQSARAPTPLMSTFQDHF